MDNSNCHATHHLCVFRDGRRPTSGRRLVEDLVAALGALGSEGTGEAWQRRAQEALLRAGELETILADQGARGVDEVARVADRLADALVGAPGARSAGQIGGAVRGALDVPGCVRVSPPEGFAYYGLHPLSFARLAERFPLASASVGVIGIRSIGATLSAVVAAALRQRGVRAERITVRPTGHPYDRSVRLSPAQLGWLTAQQARGAQFVVVDEGPGLSGSSFLSAGEALADKGIDPARVTFLCSRALDPAELIARDAARRWRVFAPHAVAPAAPPPAEAGRDLSAGAWRAHLYPEEARWPASWTMFERIKHLSLDGRRLFKFEGLGRWGAEARERARQIFEAGFGPPVTDAGDGFSAYPFLAGRPLTRADLSSSLLDRLADYCALRAAAFPAGDADLTEVTDMMRFNASQEIGRPIDLPLVLERPVIADARLMPEEWVLSAEGAIVKVDAAGHGDDHFFPGPTDIAWDLAGVMVEWQLDRAARRAFLERYRRASGDRAERRLPAFIAAYLAFRASYTKMAAGAMRGTREAERLLAAHRRYRRMLLCEVRQHAARARHLSARR